MSLPALNLHHKTHYACVSERECKGARPTAGEFKLDNICYF